MLIEVGIAKGFGVFGKKSYRFITIMNVVTQLLLNALIYKWSYDLGGFGEILALLIGEVLVFAVEAIVYGNVLPAYTGNEIKSGRASGYVFVANLASFVGGGSLLLMTNMLFGQIVRG